MNIRRWLQHLKNLRHRVRARYLQSVFHTKLCSKRVLMSEPPSQSTSESGADLLLTDEGISLRLLCSEAVTLTPAYQDWIAPLRQLPAGATPAQVKSALERLLHDQPTGKTEGVYFSKQDYLQSLPETLAQATEFVQFGYVQRQPALNLLEGFFADDAPQKTTVAPTVLLIHHQSMTNPK